MIVVAMESLRHKFEVGLKGKTNSLLVELNALQRVHRVKWFPVWDSVTQKPHFPHDLCGWWGWELLGLAAPPPPLLVASHEIESNSGSPGPGSHLPLSGRNHRTGKATKNERMMSANKTPYSHSILIAKEFYSHDEHKRFCRSTRQLRYLT